MAIHVSTNSFEAKKFTSLNSQYIKFIHMLVIWVMALLDTWKSIAGPASSLSSRNFIRVMNNWFWSDHLNFSLRCLAWGSRKLYSSWKWRKLSKPVKYLNQTEKEKTYSQMTYQFNVVRVDFSKSGANWLRQAFWDEACEPRVPESLLRLWVTHSLAFVVPLSGSQPPETLQVYACNPYAELLNTTQTPYKVWGLLCLLTRTGRISLMCKLFHVTKGIDALDTTVSKCIILPKRIRSYLSIYIVGTTP